MKTVFLRALEADDKAAVLRIAIREPEAAQGKERFEVDAASFAAVPRSPFAYWVSAGLRRLFKELEPFEAEGRVARQGGVNGDDFRYLRLWTETQSSTTNGQFLSLAKGGEYSPYYADLALQVWWNPDAETFWAFTGLPHRPSIKPASADFYLRPGLTWPRRTQGGLSVRAMPKDCVFADKGPATFVEDDVTEKLLALLAVMNAIPFRALIALQMTFGSYEVGVVQRTPMPSLLPADQSALATLACRAWILERRLDTATEASHAFMLPALLQVEGDPLISRKKMWAERVHVIKAKLAMIQAEIDERCFNLYDIDEADRRTIAEGFTTNTDGFSEADTDPDEEGAIENGTNAPVLAADLVSWAVGVAVGRFDVRLATGERPPPDEPGPFDSLSVCSPAMLTGDDGLPFTSPPAGYPVDFPENGILVDDPGHPRDLLRAVEAVFEAVFDDRAEAMLHEAATLLDPKGHDLRAWLASDFFEHHLKRYSKSRRKAPILWQLGVPSGRFGVWLYAHRLARDTFFQIRRDVVEPKLLYEERQLADLVEEAGARPSAKQRREIAAREEFIQELRVMLEEVKRLAPEWNPTLDDGVVLTMAPLWRLVPQHKAWQRELKSRWEELEGGRYDWAHIAMRHWPERVTAKCATDHSLAIAHGLSE